MDATSRTAAGPPEESAAMLTVHDVARMLCCSARSVYRLTDAGRMPRPVKLGSLVRWPQEAIEQWIAQGCPRANQEEVTV